MTYEEIVERVRKKSSICSECGCFISSLLDCCPACEWMGEKNSLVESYKALGGNSAVEKIAIQDARTSSYITSLYETRSTASKHQELIDTLSYIAGQRRLKFRWCYNATTDEYIFDYRYFYSGRECVYRQTFTREELFMYNEPAIDLAIRLIDRIPSCATLYADDKPSYIKYVPDVDYTSYYKAKTDALQAQQHTMNLYEEAIKAINSYSGNIGDKEEKVEYVYHYPF